jgi:hypothetical protein
MSHPWRKETFVVRFYIKHCRIVGIAAIYVNSNLRKQETALNQEGKHEKANFDSHFRKVLNKFFKEFPQNYKQNIGWQKEKV